MKKMSKKVVGAVLAATATMAMTVSAFAAPAAITVNFTDIASGPPTVLGSKTVSTQPLINTGTYFQGDILDAILEKSDIAPADFKMKFGKEATLLDVINAAAKDIPGGNPVYGATNSYDPNGIYVDSVFNRATDGEYGDYDSAGAPHSWAGDSWNIQYIKENGETSNAIVYANSERLADTEIATVNFTYQYSESEW